MSCSECTSVKTVTSERILAFSRGGKAPGTSSVFVLSPESILEIAPLLKRLRVTTTVGFLTEGGSVEPVLQSTEDGESWSEPTRLGKPAETNGVFTTDWYGDESSFARGIRAGIRVSNLKGDAPAFAYVSQIIDLEVR